MAMRVIFQQGQQEIGETELDILPQNTDIIYLERHEGHVKFVVIGRVWIFYKKELPYVIVELVER